MNTIHTTWCLVQLVFCCCMPSSNSSLTWGANACATSLTLRREVWLARLMCYMSGSSSIWRSARAVHTLQFMASPHGAELSEPPCSHYPNTGSAHRATFQCVINATNTSCRAVGATMASTAMAVLVLCNQGSKFKLGTRDRCRITNGSSSQGWWSTPPTWASNLSKTPVVT